MKLSAPILFPESKKFLEYFIISLSYCISKFLYNSGKSNVIKFTINIGKTLNSETFSLTIFFFCATI